MHTSKKVLSPAFIRKGLFIAVAISMLTLGRLLRSSTTADTWQSLLRIHPRNLLIMFSAVLLSWLTEGLRVKTIANLLGEEISFFNTLRINLASIFTGNITPLNSGTIPTQVYLLHQNGISVGKATAIVTIRLTFTSLLLAIGGPVLLLLFRGRILREVGLSWLSGIVDYLLILAFLYAVFMLFLLLKPAAGERVVQRIFRLKLSQQVLGAKAETFCQKTLAEISEFRGALGSLLRGNLPAVLFVLLLTACSWLSTLLIVPAILYGFGVNIKDKIFRLILLQFVVQFFLSFIPIPGGSGLAEIGFFSIFGKYLPKHLQALSVALWRLLSYYLNILVGGVCFLRLFSRNKEKNHL